MYKIKDKDIIITVPETKSDGSCGEDCALRYDATICALSLGETIDGKERGRDMFPYIAFPGKRCPKYEESVRKRKQ
jgi:hypothetical protein